MNETEGGDIVFTAGSCNRQNRPQGFWNTIRSFNPSHFFWLGDAVYIKNNSIGSMETAIDRLVNDPNYKDFVRNVSIDGVWDDHDYGMNDAGKELGNKIERMDAFKKLISAAHIPNDDGLYHSTLLSTDSVVCSMKSGTFCGKPLNGGYNKGQSVMVIFLDTRSQRDYHYIPSVAGFHRLPGSALIAAAVRAASGYLGYGRKYNGDVLGEKQWSWLDDTLRSSTADYHIIVSSIQVFTTNPVVESWGHFPLAKKRLVSLCAEIDPSGLMFLSGDVHAAEIAHIPILRSLVRPAGANSNIEYIYSNSPAPSDEFPVAESDVESNWVEVTTSGLTHTCAGTGGGYITSVIMGTLCRTMMGHFTAHRMMSTDQHHSEGAKPSHFIGLNFALFTVKGEGGEVTDGMEQQEGSAAGLHVSIRDLTNSTAGEEVLAARVDSHRLGSTANPLAPIRKVHVPDFPHVFKTDDEVIIAAAQATTVVMMLCLLGSMFVLCWLLDGQWIEESRRPFWSKNTAKTRTKRSVAAKAS